MAKLDINLQIKKALENYNKYAKIVAANSYINVMQFQLNSFISFLHERKLKNILDVGCGAGKDAVYLSDEGYSVKGIDISSPLIKIANENNYTNVFTL